MFSSQNSQVSQDATYIEDVFSTWLYTGNDSTQTITNGIDLSGKGGMVWLKSRNQTYDNALFDTNRGATKWIQSNGTDAETTTSNSLTSFNANGFTLGDHFRFNAGFNYASWTFREQPKFFDVVTYTGNGATSRQISHALGSTPGCIMVKRTDTSGYNWYVYHRSLGLNGSFPNYLFLNTTDSENGGFSAWFSAVPTSTDFSVGFFSGSGGDASLNVNGATYVAYIFAHNAGGFGLTGTDNVISCGSYTGTGAAGNFVSLGYEPQWVMVKVASSADPWVMEDNMRGMPVGGTPRVLYANSANEEFGGAFAAIDLQPTGFSLRGTDNAINASGQTYIYIAIRRGPMKVPTTGTSVFSPNLQTGGGTVTTNFPVDLIISTTPSQSGSYRIVNDRLRGGSTTRAVDLYTNVTDAETTGTGYGFGFDNNTGYRDAYYSNSFSDIYWNFRRAPGFFDEVCYTGTGSTRTVAHNLTVVPELMIVKRRNTSASWWVYAAPLGATKQLVLNTDAPENVDSTVWNDTAPTASVFTLGTLTQVNGSGSTFVAYLFASCPGVSKVGSYTGNGSSQTINCGFTGGARFVMIKRTDNTGDWYVWDTARGIVSGNDPHLSLNTTAAEVTSNDTIDTDSTGFVVNQVSATNVNVSSATYIFMAVA